jgi:hypothetical protein
VRTAFAFALAGAISLACADPKLVAAPPAAPRVEEPGLVVPGDLDLVIRLDLSRLRDSLGADFERALETVLGRAPTDAPDAATRRVFLGLLARTKTAWIAVRPGLAPELTDNVIVLRGDFQDALPNVLHGEPHWDGPRDLGGGVLKFERSAPRQRVAPAVLYVRQPDLVVLGSYAELDALERTLELGRGDPPLEPPDTGIASVAARLTVLRERVRRKAPTLGKLVEGAERLTASAAWTGGELDLRLELVLDSAARARSVAEALAAIAKRLSSGMPPERAWLERGTFDAVERFVSIRLRVPPSEFARLFTQFSGPSLESGGTVPPP